MTHVLECMARANDAGVSIWRDKIIVGETWYVMVICRELDFMNSR